MYSYLTYALQRAEQREADLGQHVRCASKEAEALNGGAQHQATRSREGSGAEAEAVHSAEGGGNLQMVGVLDGVDKEQNAGTDTEAESTEHRARRAQSTESTEHREHRAQIAQSTEHRAQCIDDRA